MSNAIVWQNMISLQYASVKFPSTHSFERWYGPIESNACQFSLCKKCLSFSTLVRMFASSIFRRIHLKSNLYSTLLAIVLFIKVEQRIVSHKVKFYWFRSDKEPFGRKIAGNTWNCQLNVGFLEIPWVCIFHECLSNKITGHAVSPV